MRRWAFILAILGIFVMALLLEFSSFKEIESYEDLEELEVNAKVFVSGSIIEERILYDRTKLLELEKGIEAVCECSGVFEGEDVLIEGVVSEYEGKKQISVLRIGPI